MCGSFSQIYESYIKNIRNWHNIYNRTYYVSLVFFCHDKKPMEPLRIFIQRRESQRNENPEYEVALTTGKNVLLKIVFPVLPDISGKQSGLKGVIDLIITNVTAYCTTGSI